MKAWLLDDKNGIDSMRLAEVDRPAPAAGEVLLRVRHAGLNPADYYLAQGQYPARPPMPHVLGRDGMGTIEEIGDGVDTFAPGDRAVILRGPVGVDRWGTFAEYVAVPHDLLVPVPDGWSEQQAAGAPLVYLTAWQALTQWGDIAPATILVTGATGGVGIASLQLGKALGHRVICLSRSEEKAQALRGMGADLVLDPGAEDLVARVREFAGRNGVALAVDNVAGELFNKLLDVMGMNGRISCVGQLAGSVPNFRTGKLFFKRLRVGGVAVGSYTREEAHAHWRRVVALLDAAGARPVVDSVFPFAQLKDAFAHLQRGPLGKVLVEIA